MKSRRPASTSPEPARRSARVDWTAAQAELDHWGYARWPRLLRGRECSALASLYDEPAHFRKRVDLARHAFGGGGDYQYFANPLPEVVAHLREALYPGLARIANGWNEKLRRKERYPATLQAFLKRCHAAGQRRPTPLLLRYGDGGFNRLHQDLYGAIAFPLQVTVLLSNPLKDFRGGEFLLVEQRARMQSRGSAVALLRGEAIVFPTQERPVESARGFSRAAMRHGVSRIEGDRVALGIIFHDAK